jgi:hypothetical protein
MRSDSKSPLYRLRHGLMLALVLLAGCSAGIRLGYNNADALILYTIDSYLGLTAEQELLVKSRLDALMSWHRATQLRDYARLIESERQRLEGKVTAADVLAFNRAINDRLLALGDRAAPDLARLALALAPEQLARMQRKIEGDNVKARRELVQAKERESLDERVNNYAERADFWFGSVTHVQRELVRASLDRRPDMSAWWLEERERRLRDLLSVLRRIQSEQPSEEVAAGWLRIYFAQLQAPAEPDRRARIQAFRTANAQLIAQLVNAATPEQKTTLSRRLAGFAQDFTALAAERIASPPG